MIPQYSFVIDYETTGFHPIRNDGISLGVIVLDHHLEPINDGYFKFKPDMIKGMNETNVATHVHGFSLNEMMNFQSRRDGLVELMRFLLPYKCPNNTPRPLFYHADNRFDYMFMEWAFRKENLQYSLWKFFQVQASFSTVLMGRDLGYEGNKLNQWATRMLEVFNHHNALDDAHMCAKIIKYILNKDFLGNVEEFFNYLTKEKKEDAKEKVQEVSEEKRDWTFFDLQTREEWDGGNAWDV